MWTIVVSAEDGCVELQEFEASAEGIIQCYTEYRIRAGTYDNTLETLWKQDKKFWN